LYVTPIPISTVPDPKKILTPSPLPQSDIDTPPTADELSAAKALIETELGLLPATDTHPLLPAPAPEKYSPLIEAEFARIAAGQPAARGIDLSRYEALSAPAELQLPLPAGAAAVRARNAEYAALLTQAYVSSTYLLSRSARLASLDASGKEEWLAGNKALVSILAALEKEFVATKEAIDLVVVERRTAQEGVRGEMELLEKSWREGMGRVLETEVAAEELRVQILEARRGGAA
jgi:pre-mRNA-splicing factor SPF27